MKNEEKIKELRSKSLSQKEGINFKKSLIGGYNPKEVEDYIESLLKLHQQSIGTYKERIDEFTTFNEMLTKEKDELDKKNKELVAKIKEEDEKIDENKPSGDELDIIKENELLKDELKEVSSDRNELSQEISILRVKSENLQVELETLKEDNKKKANEISRSYSNIRKLSSNINFSSGEYVQKQLFILQKTVDDINNILSQVENMSSDTKEFKEKINSLLNE